MLLRGGQLSGGVPKVIIFFHLSTGGPDVVFDFGDYVMFSADKTMYENTLNIALNRTCIKDLNKNVLLFVCFP